MEHRPDLGELEHYERKIYDKDQLIQISKALNSTLEFKKLIDATLNVCLAQFHTLNAAIFLEPEIDAGYLELESSFKGFEFTKQEAELQIKGDCDLIQYLYDRVDSKEEERNPRVKKTRHLATTIKELEKSNLVSASKEFKFFKSIGAEIVVPLEAKGKTNGIMVLGEKMTGEAYGYDEIDFISTLAGLAGVAVENARLYELATTDMMTGLKIHHYFQTRLREEIDRCRKKGIPLSLLFTDVDKFKVFNDTYGHQAGDVVLIEVAKKLMECSGPTDFAARYGGEEFCIVMPGSDADAGVLMGEKVRNSIQDMIVKNPADGKELKVTISVGVAEIRSTDRNNKDLIERADKALYAAKHGGRNQTRKWSE